MRRTEPVRPALRMDHLGPLELAYAAAVLLATYSVRGGVGFGGLNVPLLALVLPLKLLAPLIVLLGILSSGAVVKRDWRHIDWRAAAAIMPAASAGVVAGLWLFVVLDAALLARLLGVAIIAYGGWSLWRSLRPARPRRRPPASVGHAIGFLGAAVGTVFGAMAGVFFAMYLDLLRLDKHAFRATSAALLLILGVVRAIGYLAVDAITTDVLICFAAALPLMTLGVWVGHRLHANLDPLVFGRVVNVIFVLTGLALLVR